MAKAKATVDSKGWVRVGGVKIGKMVNQNGKPCLEVKPKDKRLNTVSVPLKELASLKEPKPSEGTGESQSPGNEP